MISVFPSVLPRGVESAITDKKLREKDDEPIRSFNSLNGLRRSLVGAARVVRCVTKDVFPGEPGELRRSTYDNDGERRMS